MPPSNEYHVYFLQVHLVNFLAQNSYCNSNYHIFRTAFHSGDVNEELDFLNHHNI